MTFITNANATGVSPIAEGMIAYYPQRWRAGVAARGTIFCHGANATYADYVQKLTDPQREIPSLIVAVNCGGATNFGNDASQTALTNAFNWLIAAAQGCRTDKVVLSGGSMGGLVALRWAKDNPTKVAAIILTIPATSLVDLHDNNRGGFATTIETAHGITGTYAGNATITGKDPAQNTASYTGFPIRIYYSTDDTLVVPSTVTTFASATGAEAISMGAQGHATGSPYTASASDDWIAKYV